MKQIIVLLIFSAIFNSCMHKKIIYIQDERDSTGKVLDFPNIAPEYLVKKNDILYIGIASTNKEINDFFEISNSQTSSSQGNTSGAFYLYGYMVNDTGYVVVPVLGGIMVEGKSIKEIQDIVQKKTDDHLNNAIATVRLVSFYVTFLGEVNSQGKLTVMQENVNILDGLALAGGTTDYGNKRQVLLVRQTTTGSQTFRVDLTDRKILSDKNYYLQPNDIIIVEPLKNKSFQLSVRDYTIILTTVTSTITMILLIASLFK